MSDKRIFDDPNHPQYGPVRRLWVILAQLDLLEAGEHWGGKHFPWDRALADLIRTEPDAGESSHQRFILMQLMRI